MQKTFKNQQGREFLLLDLPSDAVPMFTGFWGDEIEFIKSETCLHDAIKVPQGNYQILCLAKDSTEEQADKIVQGMTAGSWGVWYRNYLAKYEQFSFDIARDSLTSLLTSLGFKKDDNVLILEKI